MKLPTDIEKALGAKFPLGTIVITTAACEVLPPPVVSSALQRHAQCDWGDMCKEDKKANYAGLLNEGRLHSSYKAEDGTKFWIITESDRSATTVLLPEDY